MTMRGSSPIADAEGRLSRLERYVTSLSLCFEAGDPSVDLGWIVAAKLGLATARLAAAAKLADKIATTLHNPRSIAREGRSAH